jgi:hypothetical protein
MTIDEMVTELDRIHGGETNWDLRRRFGGTWVVQLWHPRYHFIASTIEGVLTAALEGSTCDAA